MLNDKTAVSLLKSVQHYGFTGKIGEHTTNGIKHIVVHVTDNRDYQDRLDRPHNYEDGDNLRLPALTLNSEADWVAIRPSKTRKQFEEDEAAEAQAKKKASSAKAKKKAKS